MSANPQQVMTYDPRTGVYYKWNPSTQQLESAPIKYLDTDFLMWPRMIHPDSWNDFKLRISNFINRLRATGEYGNFTVSYRVETTVQSNLGTLLVLSNPSNGKSATIHCGYLASLYNNESNTEGPTGGVYSAVTSALSRISS